MRLWSARFQPVYLDPPTPETAFKILTTLRPRYEAYHSLTITDEALSAAVHLSHRYLPDRNLPDKAIDLMDEAAACIKIQGDALPECCSELEARRRETIAALEEAIRGQDFERAALLRDAEVNFRRQLEEAHQDWRDNREQTALSVDAEDIAQVLSRWTGIPVTALTEDEAQPSAPSGGDAAPPGHRSGECRPERSRRHPPQPHRTTGGKPPSRLLPLRRTLRRGKNRAVPQSGGSPVRQ